MKHHLILVTILVALAFGALPPVQASADEGDSSSVMVSELFIGHRAVITIEVLAPRDAIVEVDSAAPSWNGVEVISAVPSPPEPDGEMARYRFVVTVAPFRIGAGTFTPAVTVLSADGVTRRELPPLSWTVVPTLDPDSPAELSPLAPPVSIGGAESPFLRPAIALGALTALALTAWLVVVAARRLGRRYAARAPEAAVVETGPTGLDELEPLLDGDPVTGYRTLAALVRNVIARDYGFPASALTTTEIRRRMEGGGANRFQARLVGGFLENCDAVVYAGYRPAGERRRADLNMAREIVDGDA
ncbi:MAG: hypothetical protein H6676_04800 [Thermoflexaceae bacterium]|nr:hypothetical protein [Thermoflexaceae bacterium]